MSEFVAEPLRQASRRMSAPHLYRVALAFRVSPTEVRRDWSFIDVFDAWLELDARAVSQERARMEAEAKHGG